LVVALIAGVMIGTVTIAPHDVLDVFAGHGSPLATTIITTLRAPRVALAALVGGALGVSGTVLQGTLRNPLAEPYLLGVSGGAGFGAVLAIITGLAAVLVPMLAFAGAVLAVGLALAVARSASGGRADTRTLLMAGVVVGAFANAAIMIMLADVPPTMVRGALWWMMGSVGDATWSSVGSLSIYFVVGTGILLQVARDVDVLTLGEENAAALGVDVGRASRRAFVVSALLAAATVAVAGLVGFVGLIVPHLTRMAGLSRTRSMLVASALVGSTLVVFADILARIARPPAELPLGAVTAVLGVPFFLVQLRRAR
jgi:iron complex transport system permease protein